MTKKIYVAGREVEIAATVKPHRKRQPRGKKPRLEQREKGEPNPDVSPHLCLVAEADHLGVGTSRVGTNRVGTVVAGCSLVCRDRVPHPHPDRRGGRTDGQERCKITASRADAPATQAGACHLVVPGGNGGLEGRPRR